MMMEQEHATAEGGPLPLLQDASPSRLLYSLMIVEHLLERDLSTPAEMASGDVDGSLEQQAAMAVAAAAAAVAAAEGDSTAARLAAMAGGSDGVADSATNNRLAPGGAVQQPPPGRSGGGGGGGGGDGNSDGDWEVYQPAAYGAAVDNFVGGGVGGVMISRGTWRDRFVSNGGIDTLVELLLMRDWDATRGDRDGAGGGGRGESTAGISLACLALLLGLVDRFLEEDYLPEPRQLGRLVSGEKVHHVLTQLPHLYHTAAEASTVITICWGSAFLKRIRSQRKACHYAYLSGWPSGWPIIPCLRWRTCVVGRVGLVASACAPASDLPSCFKLCCEMQLFFLFGFFLRKVSPPPPGTPASPHRWNASR